jgi:putative Mg2+ transporter-C (MgtC) family protein
MGINEIDRMIADWAADLKWPMEGVLRLVMAAFCAGLIGLEREIRGRQAGFRTNLLVGLGAALAMVVSQQFAHQEWNRTVEPNVNINIDPARIAYGVMTGIGFLGAGTIIQLRGTVRGLTTAAALWCVAALGLAAGFGMYLMTLLATVLILVTLWILDYIEKLIPKRRYRALVIRRPWSLGCVSETVAYFETRGVDVTDASFERKNADLATVGVSLHVSFLSKKQFYNIERQLEQDSIMTLIATQDES